MYPWQEFPTALKQYFMIGSLYLYTKPTSAKLWTYPQNFHFGYNFSCLETIVAVILDVRVKHQKYAPKCIAYLVIAAKVNYLPMLLVVIKLKIYLKLAKSAFP